MVLDMTSEMEGRDWRLDKSESSGTLRESVDEIMLEPGGG